MKASEMAVEENPLINVSVYLYGDKLDPHHVSRELGLKSSTSHKRGELIGKSTKRMAKTGMWVYEAHRYSRDASEVVAEILAQFANAPAPITSINGVSDAQLDILFAFGGILREWGSGFIISPKQIERLNQLGLSVHVTIM